MLSSSRAPLLSRWAARLLSSRWRTSLAISFSGTRSVLDVEELAPPLPFAFSPSAPWLLAGLAGAPSGASLNIGRQVRWWRRW
eukprot:1360674-Pyramimonas_sp.AAC.1